MDIRFTFSSSKGVVASVYVSPEFEPPESLVFTTDGKQVAFVLLSDRSLECADSRGVSGHCTSGDCHRRVLGQCQCGRHPSPVRFARAGT